VIRCKKDTLHKIKCNCYRWTDDEERHRRQGCAVGSSDVIWNDVGKQVSFSVMFRDFGFQRRSRRSALLWDITQRIVGIAYWLFGTTLSVPSSRWSSWKLDPEVVPKRRQGITNKRCVISQDSASLLSYVIVYRFRCVLFIVLHTANEYGDRDSTVVKVLCCKSEDTWCQWIFHWHKILPIALWPWCRLNL
jgi:hypothetical protein